MNKKPLPSFSCGQCGLVVGEGRGMNPEEKGTEKVWKVGKEGTESRIPKVTGSRRNRKK